MIQTHDTTWPHMAPHGSAWNVRIEYRSWSLVSTRATIEVYVALTVLLCSPDLSISTSRFLSMVRQHLIPYS